VSSTDDHRKPPSTRDATERHPLKSKAADLLDVHGGLVLVTFGAGLIALACIYASHAAVAPVFAVFGATLVVIGAFYSRIAGPVQGGSSGFSFTVVEAQRLAVEREYPPDIIDELPDRVAELAAPSDEWKRWHVEWRSVADQAVESFSDVVHQRETDLIGRFGAWLQEQGLQAVKSDERGPDPGYDLLAQSDDAVLVVEAKVGPKTVGQHVVRSVLAADPPFDPRSRPVRRAVVIPHDLKMSEHALGLAAAKGVEVYEVEDNGPIKRVV
jgi:hypothetical protein